MCEIYPQVHIVVQCPDGSFCVRRYNYVKRDYETVHFSLSELDANRIKKELDADLNEQ